MPGKLYTYSSYIDLFMYSPAPAIKTLYVDCYFFLHQTISIYFLFSKLTKAATSFEKKNVPKPLKKKTYRKKMVNIGRAYNHSFLSLHMSYYSLCIIDYHIFPLKNDMSFFM